jgi:probable selenium-dependent hydroxylase accessory protein YqeC
VEALYARKGVVCMVGAGGKKSTMYRLAQAHDGRVAVTTTVHIPPFPQWLDAAPVVADAGDLEAMVLAQAAHRSRLAYATRTDKPGRFGGVAAQTVARLHEQARFDVTLVKADGARRRQIKGPGGREPIVPEQAATVLAAVSAQTAGQPLDPRVAHYMENIAALLGVRPGEVLTPRHIAQTLAAYLQGDWLPDGARLVPLINMAEDRQSRRAAEEIAATLLDLAPRVTRVVITHMQGDDPLVAVVQR